MKTDHWPAIVPAVLLSILSCLVVSSVAGARLWYQIAFFGAGIGFYFLICKTGWYQWVVWAPVWFGIVGLLLVLTAIIGAEVRGSTRWLNLGLVQFQVSEWAKLALLLLVARFYRDGRLTTRQALVTAAAFAFLAGMVFLQPDLGTAVILAMIFFSMFFGSEIRLRIKIVTLAGLLLLIPLVYTQLKPYQQDRLVSFWNPYHDPAHAGYNVIQSMIAIGSGGVWGKGLGTGTQSQLNFLPERQTDFIFAAMVEELGLAGGLLALALYAWLFWLMANRLAATGHRCARLLILGAAAALFGQTVINIGMNLGIMPVTGVPLPLFSVGGNSILVTYTLVGLADSVPIATRREPLLTIG